MKNEQLYKETFDQVHVSEALLGKVMDMETIRTEQKNRRAKRWRYAMGTLAAAAGVFIISNGVCYAATGETWVSRMTIHMNGQKTEQEVQWEELDDGTFMGRVEAGDAEGDVDIFAFTDDAQQAQQDYTIRIDGENGASDYTISGNGPVTDDDMATADFTFTEYCVETRDDGSVWFMLTEAGETKLEVDLTEDMADGLAEGCASYGGLTFLYQVEGPAGGTGEDADYDLAVSVEMAQEEQ